MMKAITKIWYHIFSSSFANDTITGLVGSISDYSIGRHYQASYPNSTPRLKN